MDGRDRALERDHRFNLERDNQRAQDGLHAAAVFVHHAGVVLRKIRDGGRDRG